MLIEALKVEEDVHKAIINRIRKGWWGERGSLCSAKARLRLGKKVGGGWVKTHNRVSFKHYALPSRMARASTKSDI